MTELAEESRSYWREPSLLFPVLATAAAVVAAFLATRVVNAIERGFEQRAAV